MREINITADDLVSSLLGLSRQKQVCLLDSCGVSHLGAHLLIAGIEPLETLNITGENPSETLELFSKKLSPPELAGIFTISYDLGLKLENIRPREKKFPAPTETDIFLAVFDCLITHDYNTGKTQLAGNEANFDKIEKYLLDSNFPKNPKNTEKSKISSNFSKAHYVSAVEKIQEFIKCGDTYQTNLTRQIRAQLPENLTAQKIFQSLRKSHPAPFAAFFRRKNDYVVSISPERFLKVQKAKAELQGWRISTSPIKGTKPRGQTAAEDKFLRDALLSSEKDKAENVMIVDLLRNDIGRICEFGSVEVEKLCDLETHPTLFHLVSTVSGKLRENVDFADIIKAVFPCGSITGAPKIRTMRIIDEFETAGRGLSMGAIGYFVTDNERWNLENKIDMNVAIRTMLVREREAIFNVGGGIVIDSKPEDEYAETLLKAQALLNAINAEALS